MPFHHLPPDENIIETFQDLIGEEHVITDKTLMRPFMVEWRDRYVGDAACVLCPGNTQDVSKIISIAYKENIAIVPQGGNTGLVGGQIPDRSEAQIVLNLSRLNKVRDISKDNNSMTLEAGVTLSKAQEIALNHDRLFPLSFGSKDKCQIGGNLATNAGGLAVLHYGNARSLVLGLEVVLADGQIWDGLKTLHKDNSGYSLKDLFVGSEGTLGIITAACLKLFPKPVEKITAFAGIPNLDDLNAFYSLSRAIAGQHLTAFEILPDIAIELLNKHLENATRPLKQTYPWYVMMELSSSYESDHVKEQCTKIIDEALSAKLINEGIVATSDDHAKQLWNMRSRMSNVQKMEGGSIKHDVSVPIMYIPEFITRANDLVQLMIPGCRPIPFGHFGDGNIHYNITQPANMDKNVFLAKWESINTAVHEIVVDLNGSISAEHGIGQMKKDLLKDIKSPLELKLMQDIKKVLDPKGILNPGKLIDS